MARLSRGQILYDGCYAHVISRSIRQMDICRDEEDFRVFREGLLKAKKEGGFRVFHYCLMHTHFHLAVHMPDVQKFSRSIQKLKSQYISKYHTKYRLSGPMWRERYRSLLIENEEYLYACGQYIENNPVKAAMVSRNEQWEFSSSGHYQGSRQDELVDGYEAGYSPELPSDVDISNDAEFEEGAAIGSGYFKLMLGKKNSIGLGGGLEE